MSGPGLGGQRNQDFVMREEKCLSGGRRGSHLPQTSGVLRDGACLHVSKEGGVEESQERKGRAVRMGVTGACAVLALPCELSAGLQQLHQ